MVDYRGLFELAARYLDGALYLSEAKRLRRLSAAPIFRSDEEAVAIIARCSAELEEALEREDCDADLNAMRGAALAELRGEEGERREAVLRLRYAPLRMREAEGGRGKEGCEGREARGGPSTALRSAQDARGGRGKEEW